MPACPTNYPPYIDQNGELSNKHGVKATGVMFKNSLELIDHVSTQVYGDVLRMDGSRMSFAEQYTLIRGKMLAHMERHQGSIKRIDNKIKEGKALTFEETNSYLDVKSFGSAIGEHETVYNTIAAEGKLMSTNPLEASENINLRKARIRKNLVTHLTKEGVLKADGTMQAKRGGGEHLSKIQGVQLDGTRQIFKPLAKALEVISNRGKLTKDLTALDEVELGLINKFSKINLDPFAESLVRGKGEELGLLANPYKKEFPYKMMDTVASLGKLGAVSTTFANIAQSYFDHMPLIGYASEKVSQRLNLELHNLDFLDRHTSSDAKDWYKDNKHNYGIVRDIDGISGVKDLSGIKSTTGEGKLDKFADACNWLASIGSVRMLEHLRNASNKRALHATEVWSKANNVAVGSKEFVEFFEEAYTQIAVASHLSHKALITSPSFGGKGVFHINSVFNLADMGANAMYKDDGSVLSGMGVGVKTMSDTVGKTFTGWFHEAWKKQWDHIGINPSKGKDMLEGKFYNSKDRGLQLHSMAMITGQAALLGATALAPVALVADIAGLINNTINPDQDSEKTASIINSRLSVLSNAFPDLVKNMSFSKNSMSPLGIMSMVLGNIATPGTVLFSLAQGKDPEDAVGKVNSIGMALNKVARISKLSKRFKNGEYDGDPTALVLDSVEAVLSMTAAKGTMDSITRSASLLSGGVQDNRRMSDIITGATSKPYDGYGESVRERSAATILSLFGARTQYEIDRLDEWTQQSDDAMRKIVDRVASGQLRTQE